MGIYNAAVKGKMTRADTIGGGDGEGEKEGLRKRCKGWEYCCEEGKEVCRNMRGFMGVGGIGVGMCKETDGIIVMEWWRKWNGMGMSVGARVGEVASEGQKESRKLGKSMGTKGSTGLS